VCVSVRVAVCVAECVAGGHSQKQSCTSFTIQNSYRSDFRELYFCHYSSMVSQRVREGETVAVHNQETVAELQTVSEEETAAGSRAASEEAKGSVGAAKKGGREETVAEK